MADQSLEESIAAFEDQSRLLQSIVKRSGLIEKSDGSDSNIILETIDGAEVPFEKHHTAISNSEEDQYHTLAQFAQTRQELQKARTEYFQRKLQKEEDLGTAIDLATQEIRYLDQKLRELNKQLDNNFIYASITGTVVGANIAKAGTYYEKFEPVFELQPIKNEFQISIVIDEADINKFKTGTPSTITLDKTPTHKGQLSATTIAVLRKPNGSLEALLNLDGDSKRNADIILASGYRGEGEQRLPANITTGQDKIWRSISELVLKEPANGSL
jgi:multidrug resistance efflux pump